MFRIVFPIRRRSQAGRIPRRTIVGLLALAAGLTDPTAVHGQTYYIIESQPGGQHAADRTSGPGNWQFTSNHSTAAGCTPGIGALFASSDAPSFSITPTLATPGATYRLEASFGSNNSNSSPDLIVGITATKCTGLPATTNRFQRTYANNTWQTIGEFALDPGENQPTITFTYQSGTLASTGGRFLSDAFRLTLLGDSCETVAPIGIDGPLYEGNYLHLVGLSSQATEFRIYADGVLQGTTTSPWWAPLIKGKSMTATQVIDGQEGCVPPPFSGPVVGGAANPRVGISLSLRRNPSLTGPIGASGESVSPDLFWMPGTGAVHDAGGAVAGTRILSPDACWQTVTFDRSVDPVYRWSGSSADTLDGDFASLDSIYFSLIDDDTGPYLVYIDDIRNGDTLITGFEGSSWGTPYTRLPNYSPTTSHYLNQASYNVAHVLLDTAASGQASYLVAWQFNSTVHQTQAMRLVIQSPGIGINYPQVDLRLPITMRILLLPERWAVDGEPDPDHDEICPIDNCPHTSNPDQADADGDGVGDVCDNCMNTPNPDQADSDWDGVGDACDACPYNSIKTEPGLCGCEWLFDDDDGDGVLSCEDNCIYHPNPDQANADGDAWGDACDNCPQLATEWEQWDSDNDAVGDACDGCPNDPEKANPGVCGCHYADLDLDGDGIPECADLCPGVPDAAQIDTDGDGVGDACDNCPAVPNALQNDTDADMLGDECDPDIDGDGIPNGADNCPKISNPGQEDTDQDGVGDACRQAELPVREWRLPHSLDGVMDYMIDPIGLGVDAVGHLLLGRTGIEQNFMPVSATRLSPEGATLWTSVFNADRAIYLGRSFMKSSSAGEVYIATSEYTLTGRPMVIKYGADGAQQWVASSPTIQSLYIGGFALDATGNTYLAGATFDQLGIVKFDHQGQQVWSALTSGPWQLDPFVNGIAVDASGNLYVNHQAFLTIKFDSAGVQEWAAQYGDPGESVASADIAIDPAGNVVVTGTRSFPGTDGQAVTIKYAPNGQVLWTRYLALHGSNVNPRNCAIDSTGHVYILARVSTAGTDTTGLYFLIKYSPNGVRQWVASQLRLDLGWEMIALDVDSQGNAYVLTSNPTDTELHPYSSVRFGLQTSKYNAAGEQEWAAREYGDHFNSRVFVARGNDGTVYSSGQLGTVKYAPSHYSGTVRASDVRLVSTLPVPDGTLELWSSWLYGPGRLQLGPEATLKITGDAPGAGPTRVSAGIVGLGTIQIDAGHQLTLEGDAVVDLTDGQGNRGNISIDGTLLIRDHACLRNAEVTVRQAEITTDQPVQFNSIHLLDAIEAGGQFFAQGHARILDNIILSEGDRYFDFDPDPAAEVHPTFSGNQVAVVIRTKPEFPRGTLLELRARDADCGPGGTNPACSSGAHQTTVTGRFAEEPSHNWVLDRLELEPGAKLTLTNRPGLQFQADTTYPETVYVRHLILHAGAVLNTGLQSLYYETLTMDPSAQIVDVPLLGFSLGNIAFDDATPEPFNEFDTRVRFSGGVTRLPYVEPPGSGAMEMFTASLDSPARAKGSYARAGDEDITVVFEYLFVENPNAELVVYLSDRPDVDDRSFEVGRVRMPTPGRAGSIGSSQFATFVATFPRVVPGVYELNFTRGTYVEVALLASDDGQGGVLPARVWIDNLDPQVICRFECASFDGVPGVTEADYLILLAEYGRALGATDPKSCLDSRVSRDKYVETADLLAWDTFFEGFLNSCGTGTAARAAATPASHGGSGLPRNRFIVSGKPAGAGRQSDALYTVRANGVAESAVHAPAGGQESRANGRLIRDTPGSLYQLHGLSGLVRLTDGVSVVAPGVRNFGGNTVHIGVSPTGDGGFTGLPLTDAAFAPGQTSTLYVAPILVSVPAQGSTPAHDYRAAARLELIAGSYNLVQLYGQDPYTDPDVTTTPPEASPYCVQWIRELEVSRDGEWLFVVCAHALNDNEWLLAYNSTSGQGYRTSLTALSPALRNPVALLASSAQDKLYLATAVGSSGTARVYRMSVTGPAFSLDGCVQIGDMRQVTSILERPGDSAIHVFGFQAPSFDEGETFGDDDAIFASPRWAGIPAGTNWSHGSPETVTAAALTGLDLALPLSAVFAPTGTDLNADGSVDQADVLLLRNCATRSHVPYAPAALPPGCTLQPDAESKLPADFDRDGDIDLDDWAVLQRCYAGPGTAPDPRCDN